jgi:dipeptidyl aminopeptidase/acylaminoacyl peptidase
MLASFVTLAAASLSSASPSPHPWTFKDTVSIEQVGALDVGDDSSSFVYSSDGRRVAFIISRGVPGTSRTSATIYVYDVADLRDFAASATSRLPAPLVRFTSETIDNVAAVRLLHWTAAGDLLFVAKAQKGDALYSWRPGRRPFLETRFGTQILDVRPLGDGARLLVETAVDRVPVNDDVPRLANGHTLEAVIATDTFTTNFGRPARLSVLNRKDHKTKSYEATVLARFGLWPSPDSRYVVAYTPFASASSVECWSPGEEKVPGLYVERAGRDQVAYLLIDLLTGDARLPLAAPSGSAVPGFGASAYYFDGFGPALWSGDSKTVVATFGLDAASRCGGAAAPFLPAAYAIDIRSMGVQKLQTYGVEAPEASYHLYTVAASISADGSKIQLATGPQSSHGWHQDAGTTFERSGGRWVATGGWTAPAPSAPADPKMLAIEQSLNTLPILSVDDGQGHRRALRKLGPSDVELSDVSVSIYRWKDKNGRDWSGTLAVPAGHTSARLPLIVQTHGYPEGAFFSSGAEAQTCFPGRAAVSRGFAVLTVNEALGKAMDDTLEEGRAVADGYAAAVQALSSSDTIDPERVAGIGWSRSGWWLETTINRYPKLFKAASICDNVDYGYVQYLLSAPTSPEYKRGFETKYGGTPWQNPTSWQSDSPPFNLARARVPIRFESDTQLLYAPYEWEGFQTLRLNHVPSDFWVLPGGTHLLARPSDAEFSEKGSLDWIDYWLNGHLEEDPADPGRNTRWTAMKRESDQ